MSIILMAQMQMAFNVNALPVSIGAISYDLETTAGAIGTALVVYSLFVAAFVMLGAKIGKIIGERLAFQITVLLHGAAMAMMALAQDERTMNNAQALAGLAAAVLVPTLVVLIAANYKDQQKEQALGLLAGAPAMAGVLAFIIAGFLATALSWRYSFALMTLISVVVFFLSFRLQPVPRKKGIKIDWMGAVLAAIGVIMISLGFNNLNSWGVLLARPNAPFTLFGISPAVMLIIVGAVVGQAFFTWSFARQAQGKAPLFALEVLDTRQKRAATYALVIISALGPAVNFLVPLYMQIVQGNTSMQTAIATVPYTLAIFTAATLIVRFYGSFSPRIIGSAGFTIVAVGLVTLAYSIQNQWGTPLVIFALLIIGMGEGALITLVFNVLVTSSPKELAGDIGALRGTANNLSTAVGTALAGALSIGLLGVFVNASLVNNPTIPPALIYQVDLNSIDFVSNDSLGDLLATNTTATQEQKEEALRINTETRLRALKISLLVLAGISALAIFPSLGLPGNTQGQVPATKEPVDTKSRRKNNKRQPAPVA
jgi:MFS family permease